MIDEDETREGRKKEKKEEKEVKKEDKKKKNKKNKNKDNTENVETKKEDEKEVEPESEVCFISNFQGFSNLLILGHFAFVLYSLLWSGLFDQG